MHPLDLVSAAPWRRVAFTTYALSLSFFEAVVLDALIRGGGRSATILADPLGVRAGLSEQGARRAGREYEVEPVACLTGAFHPKLGIYLTDTDCHLTVGSGNLTFGGWGVNLECLEHLHSSFAADAIDDAVTMLELLPDDERVRTGATATLLSLADDMRRCTAGARRTGAIRLLHSVGQNVGDMIADLADGLGGATGLAVMSPFFNLGSGGLSKLARSLTLDHVSVHVHPGGPVPGLTGTNWPANADIAIEPVLIDDPLTADGRRLHAKSIEIMCRRGRLLVSGSPNATHAGLYSGNIEAAVARVQRDTTLGWSFSPCAPPPPDLRASNDADEKSPTDIGVLQATLDGETLRGIVLLPPMSGAAKLHCLSTSGTIDLGVVHLDAHGRFEAQAPGIEELGWSGNRLVIRVEHGDAAAEGFVSLAVAGDIARRAGVAASRIFAMLAGTETPDDVAAIFSWYHEDPSRLGRAPVAVSSGSSGEKVREPVFVSVADLRGNGDDRPTGDATSPSQPGSAWERALALVQAAFSQARGPWPGGRGGDANASGGGGGGDEEEGEDDTEDEREKRRAREEAAKRRAANALSSLLEVMLATSHAGRHVRTAFWMAHYVSDRNRPDTVIARGWLRRIVQASRDLDSREDAGLLTATLMLIAAEEGLGAPMKARRHLLERGVDPATVVLDLDAIPGFAAVLAGNDLASFRDQIVASRTAGEQVALFLAACDAGGDRDRFPLLRGSASWSRLARALDDPAARQRLHVYEHPPAACPKCNIKLPRAHVEDLRDFGVTHCCRVMLCTGS